MRSKIILAALAATAAFASPAMAQTVSTDTAQARGIVLLPLTLTHDDTQPLDFGTVMASPLAGTVSINADDGSRLVSGGVTAIALDVGGRAIFNGLGTAGQLVDLTLTPPVGGAFVVGVGGEFAIAANQTNGVYSADFTVTAEYQ